MAITRIYNSETNLLNNIKPYTSPTLSENRVETLPVKPSEKYKKGIYAGVGIVALLGLLLLRGGKLLKGLQKLIKKENPCEFSLPYNKSYECVSLPDNKPIDVEVVDTRFLRRNSKLRVTPEIVDVEFQEI